MNLQQRSMITSEDIYQDLCGKIENLEYMPGELISENELCVHYATSRHMVRGAFAMLRERKLLEVYPQRGSYVSLIDMKYISDIVYLRESIEQEAAQRLIDMETEVDEVCDRMEASIEQQKICLRDKTPNAEFYRLDTQFHRYVLEAVGKGDIMDMMADSYIHFRRWRNLELRSMMRVENLIEEHRAIVAALRSRDRMLTRKVLHEHIDATRLYDSVCEKTQNEYFYKR